MDNVLAPVLLFNTLTRSVEPLNTITPGQVGIYCCGPTVYAYQHIGNMKTYIFEDVLVRTLRFAGYKVKHVMNITDVGHLVSDADEGEDKMLVAMKREKKKSSEIADFYTRAFFVDWDKLNLTRPDVVCKATEHVQDMIALIQRIEKNGFTYVANGNVYFDVLKFQSYGRLAKLDLDKLQAGARIEVDQNKKSPFDFVLWFTNSKFENQELQWDSPWGRGYPGWHIECSAMSAKYLGEQFEIHCGGVDHISVHHTNEIAQTEAATGKSPWVQIWMHSDFVLFNKDKMSKSKGGVIVLNDLIERCLDPISYRYFCMSGHYRSQLNFTFEAIEGAENSLKSLRNAVLALKESLPKGYVADVSDLPEEYAKRFSSSMFNDVNTPQALAVVWELCGDKSVGPEQKINFLAHADSILGLGIELWKEESLEIPPQVSALLRAREEARATKDWSKADSLRKEILEIGYSVEDSAKGSKVRKV